MRHSVSSGGEQQRVGRGGDGVRALEAAGVGGDGDPSQLAAGGASGPPRLPRRAPLLRAGLLQRARPPPLEAESVTESLCFDGHSRGHVSSCSQPLSAVSVRTPRIHALHETAFPPRPRCTHGIGPPCVRASGRRGGVCPACSPPPGAFSEPGAEPPRSLLPAGGAASHADPPLGAPAAPHQGGPGGRKAAPPPSGRVGDGRHRARGCRAKPREPSRSRP